MATDLELQLATVEYSNILDLRLQQRAPRIRGKTLEAKHVGKAASPISYTSPLSMMAPSGVDGPLNVVRTAKTRRWVTPVAYEVTERVDTYEELQTIINPTSEFVADQAAAVYRAWDDQLISAVFGTATIGVDPGGFQQETWTNAQTTATGSSTGLTIASTFGNGSTAIGLTAAKIAEATRIFQELYVDLDEPRFMVIGPTQWSDLTKEVQMTNRDFYDSDFLATARLPMFMGWQFIISNRLPVSSSVRQCFAFNRKGLHFGSWEDMYADVSINKNVASYPIQVYTRTMIGATRLEPGRVLEIDCGNDTAGVAQF